MTGPEGTVALVELPPPPQALKDKVKQLAVMEINRRADMGDPQKLWMADGKYTFILLYLQFI
ncbi:hypothetical protein GCM10011396_38490 [Undibacterium terreum]|uniref:Uncharacterized protein n=1 Tax=Undibacterium terreum TaxID=1224302 RepID=A0A916XNK0_9BURK|nr:hypothetical protein GCM10011396_38490 [Undibacterium terreum]